MTAKTWNRITAAGAVIIMLGFLLTIFRVGFGQPFIIAGIVVFVVGMIGTFYRAIKNPLRCPKCGEVLTNGGNRTRTSGLQGRSDIITCARCGTEIDVLALYRANKL